MEVNSVKDALVYANALIKTETDTLTVTIDDTNVKKLLLDTIDYVKKKTFCDQKNIQALLNNVYKYYLGIMESTKKCDDDDFYQIVNSKYLLTRSNYKDTLLEEFACKLLMDVANLVICNKYATA